MRGITTIDSVLKQPYLKSVKIYLFYKLLLGKKGFPVDTEFRSISFKPYGYLNFKLTT